MKKHLSLLLLFFLLTGVSGAGHFDVQPVRVFGRTNREAAAVMINGKVSLRLYAPSSAGEQAFDRVEKAVSAINKLLDRGICAGSAEPVSTEKGASVFICSVEVLSVEPDDTRNTYMPPLLIAYNWANRLRWSFGEPLLPQASIDEVIRAERLRGHDIEVRKSKWGDKAEVVVDGRVVMRISQTDPDLSAYDTAREIALVMEEEISKGLGGEDIRPAINRNNEYGIKLGSSVLSLVRREEDPATGSDYWSATLDRANRMRSAFGADPFSVETARSVFTQYGIASWYGGFFHGRTAASGERYDMNEFTAAHKTLPFGTEVLVTRLDNNKSVLVRITDRGPYIAGRIIDLSRAAAESIGLIGQGIVRVRIDILERPQRTRR